MKRSAIIAAGVLLVLLSGCQTEKKITMGEGKRDNRAAIAALQIINTNAQTCWMKSKV